MLEPTLHNYIHDITKGGHYKPIGYKNPCAILVMVNTLVLAAKCTFYKLIMDHEVSFTLTGFLANQQQTTQFHSNAPYSVECLVSKLHTSALTAIM